jgi:hypothetical protein
LGFDVTDAGIEDDAQYSLNLCYPSKSTKCGAVASNCVSALEAVLARGMRVGAGLRIAAHEHLPASIGG